MKKTSVRKNGQLPEKIDIIEKLHAIELHKIMLLTNICYKLT